MNLYIWADPHHVPYGGSLLVAVAETLDEAKAIAKRSPCYEFGGYLGDITGDQIPLGEPTRVVPVPCAEWHQWSE